MTFHQLNLHPSLLKAIDGLGYDAPTPIQAQAIPVLMDGHDLLGCAQTGTGKTAAFSLPILNTLQQTLPPKGQRKHIRALILTPTRELAIQIGDSIRDYGKHTPLRHAVIFGGVKQGGQVRQLQQGVDILVATPGRLLDLVNQGYVRFDQVEHFVLDEADRMLDMGFIHDVRRIVKMLPEERQTLLFSATMPPEIVKLSRAMLNNPQRVDIAPEKPTAETVAQSIYYVDKGQKNELLKHVIQGEQMEAVLVFTRTKYGADKVVRMLTKSKISAEAIHGNKSQSRRQEALKNFKRGKTRVLVATDIAARGIDVDGLDYVINYEIPNISETYVHRIGRTGRAGNTGRAMSFCMPEEVKDLRNIEKLIGFGVPVVDGHPFESENPGAYKASQQKSNNGKRPQQKKKKRSQKSHGTTSSFGVHLEGKGRRKSRNGRRYS